MNFILVRYLNAFGPADRDVRERALLNGGWGLKSYSHLPGQYVWGLRKVNTGEVENKGHSEFQVGPFVFNDTNFVALKLRSLTNTTVLDPSVHLLSSMRPLIFVTLQRYGRDRRPCFLLPPQWPRVPNPSDYQQASHPRPHLLFIEDDLYDGFCLSPSLWDRRGKEGGQSNHEDDRFRLTFRRLLPCTLTRTFSIRKT